MWLLLAGCVKQDNFGTKLAQGCATEAACNRLVSEAVSRNAKCKPFTMGYLDCAETRPQLERARELQRAHTEKAATERAERDRKNAQAEREEEEAAEREEEAAREAQRRADAAARGLEASEAWAKLVPKKRALELDKETCLDLEAFVARFDGTPEAAEATVMLKAAREERARRERDAEERRDRASAAAAQEAAKNAPKPKRARCCNGTFDSSCTSEGQNGCCFGRGNVCAWE